MAAIVFKGSQLQSLKKVLERFNDSYWIHSLGLSPCSLFPGGSLPLWPVHHAQPQPFKKHPKHGFYPLLKWHPKHITWVIFDTLSRDFCSSVRFHTLNKEYCVISPVILYPKQESLFSYPKQGKSTGKNLVTNLASQGTQEPIMRETEKKKVWWFLLS